MNIILRDEMVGESTSPCHPPTSTPFRNVKNRNIRKKIKIPKQKENLLLSKNKPKNVNKTFILVFLLKCSNSNTVLRFSAIILFDFVKKIKAMMFSASYFRSSK